MEQIRIKPRVYSLDIIKKAAYACLDKAYVVLDMEGGDILVNIIPKESYDKEKLGLEFHDLLITFSNFDISQKENADTIKTIIERALFSTSPALIQEVEEQEINDLLSELEKDPEYEQVAKEWQDDKAQ